MYNYYQDQVNRLGQANLEECPVLQIVANGKNTHWLNVNEESAPVLIEWLKQFVKTRTIADLERTGELPTTY